MLFTKTRFRPILSPFIAWFIFNIVVMATEWVTRNQTHPEPLENRPGTKTVATCSKPGQIAEPWNPRKKLAEPWNRRNRTKEPQVGSLGQNRFTRTNGSFPKMGTAPERFTLSKLAAVHFFINTPHFQSFSFIIHLFSYSLYLIT